MYEALRKSILKELPQVKALLNLSEEVRFCDTCPFKPKNGSGCGHYHAGGCLRLYFADPQRLNLFMGPCLYFVDFSYADEGAIVFNTEFARLEFVKMLETLSQEACCH